MSHQYPVSAAGDQRALRRPTTLSAALGTGLVAGALALIAGIALVITGRASVEGYLIDELGAETAALAGDLATEQVEEVVGALQTKAVAGIIAATLVIILAMFAGRASKLVRGLFVPVSMASAFISVGQLADADVLHLAVKAPALISLVAVLVAVVLMVSRPVNQYGKALRGVR